MNRKLGVALGLVFWLSVGAWLFFTPYLAVQNMRAAAAAKDGATVSSYVDFPALRESLKVSVGAKLAQLSGPSQNNPLAAIGAAMATTLADPLIDTLVTPEGVESLLQGDVPARVTAMVGVAVPDTQVDTSMGYASLNTFILTVTKRGATLNPINFTMTRSGLISWKLTAVTLP